MVAIIIPAVIAGLIIFFGSGGLQNVRGFFGSVPTTEEKDTGTLVVPTLQSGSGTVPISAGSRRTVENIEVQGIIRTSVADKRKFNPQQEKPPIQVIFTNTKQGGVLSSNTGQIVGANVTGSFGFGDATKTTFGLNALEIQQIRERALTEQEIQDIDKLKIRFQRKSVSAQRVSDSPEEIVFKKREQDAISRKVIESRFGAGSFVIQGGKVAERFGLVRSTQSKLFAKPNFIFGGVSEEVFLKQRAQKRDQFNRLKENRRKAEEETARGKVITAQLIETGQSQREFLLTRGIALRGGVLNERALGKLQARGLI